MCCGQIPVQVCSHKFLSDRIFYNVELFLMHSFSFQFSAVLFAEGLPTFHHRQSECEVVREVAGIFKVEALENVCTDHVPIILSPSQ